MSVSKKDVAKLLDYLVITNINFAASNSSRDVKSNIFNSFNFYEFFNKDVSKEDVKTLTLAASLVLSVIAESETLSINSWAEKILEDLNYYI